MPGQKNNIKRRRYKMTIDETDQETGVFAISLVEAPAIEENWVYLSKQHKIMLSEANGEKRLLIGPVLIPNKEIPRIDQETGEEYDIVFDEAVIEKAAQLFLQRQYNNESTLEHNRPINDISIVESWLVTDSKADKSNAYGLSYPKGTWMVMAKVQNDLIWNDYVKTGKVKGFSLEGLFGHNLVEASKQQLSAVEDWDIEYAEELLAQIKGIIKSDGRVKGGKFVELETYNDYPDTVRNNAKRGIELNEKVDNKCATPVGKIRAQQLANGRNISIQTIKRMYAYTSRAREFYNPDDKEACGTISYLLWGGDAANRWSAAKLKELGLFEGETAVSIASSYAGQFGGPGVMKSKKPKYSNYVDTTNMSTQFIAGPTSKKDKKRFPGNRGTMFYPYIAPAMLEDDVNMDVFGYNTKFFQICPGAQATFKSLVMLPNLEEDNIGMIRSAAVIADAVFKIENDVLEAKTATQSQLDEAIVLVDDYKDIISEIDEDNNTSTDVSYMDNHIDLIKSLIPVELQDFEQGPCQDGYVQIGMKDLDGRLVPNCVPESVNLKKRNITLIACSATKLEKACMAKDMYQGNLFKKSLEYALKTTNPKDVYILSAKYGLVDLEQVIEPYDKSLMDMDDEETNSWSAMVMDKLEDLYEDLAELQVSILAGKAYYEPLTSLIKNYDLPLEGLRIGESMKELDELVAAELSQLTEEDRMEVILDVLLMQIK